MAELSAIELTASVGQARAALAAATADRNNVYAGVRAEQIASLAAEIAKAKSRLEYAEQQLSRTAYLARSETASQQTLDQAENDAASARADVAEAQANYDAAVAGPTKEERAIADAQVKAAAVRARGARTPARQDHPAGAGRRHCQRDRRRGRGEHSCRPAGARDRGDRQAVAVVQRARRSRCTASRSGRRSMSARAGAREPTPALVTELMPLGSFATWQAERAIGDHDRSTLRLRLDPQGDPAGLEPGMTVWLNR